MQDKKPLKYTIQHEKPRQDRKDFLAGRGILPGDKIIDARGLTDSELNNLLHSPPSIDS